MARAKRQRLRKGLILGSLLLFPVTLYYFSPVLAIESAAYGVLGGSLLVFLLLFGSALVLGRAWCGWACPGAGLAEACFTVNDNRFSGGPWNWTKWVIWVPWISLVAFVAIQAGGITDIDPFFRTVRTVQQAGPGGVLETPTLITGVSVVDLQSYVIYVAILALIAVPSLLAGRRAFCHSVCWMAPFMVLGRLLRNAINSPALQLRATAANCADCRRCTKNCPMSLEVHELVARQNMEHSECILCGTCADNCPNGVISYEFGRRY